MVRRENHVRTEPSSQGFEPLVPPQPSSGFTGLRAQAKLANVNRHTVAERECPYLLGHGGAVRMDAMIDVTDNQLQLVHVSSLDQKVEKRGGIGTSRHGNQRRTWGQVQAGKMTAECLDEGHAPKHNRGWTEAGTGIPFLPRSARRGGSLMSHAVRMNLTRLILWAAPLAGIACGGGGTDVVLPALRITTTTTGVEIDPDGYTISIDGQAAQALGLNATLAVDQIADGSHTVALSGIAGNCVVGGQNPQTVSVTSGSTTTVAFAITCSAPLGSIQVVTTTSATGGGEIDPDGYSISIDGLAAQPIGLNATLTIDGIADGAHTVELAGIAGNCGVGGQNPQTVSVAAGSTASLSFEVSCASGTGSIQVVTTTTGAGTDPDGFALLLDGADRGSIAVSATSSLTGVTAGAHSIGLTGLAGNCQISGENPRAVSVPAGGTAPVAFAISCTAPGATTGNLEIVTVTTGPSQDPNGYLISVDGAVGQPIGNNATVTLSNITAVLHTVQLQGQAAN